MTRTAERRGAVEEWRGAREGSPTTDEESMRGKSGTGM